MKVVNLLRGLRTRWSSINLTLLRLFLKVVPSESHRVFAVALAAGALCGLSAVSFHLAISATENKLIERALHNPSSRLSTWLIVLIPTAGALLCGVILQFIVPGARGSGIPQVKSLRASVGPRRFLAKTFDVYYQLALLQELRQPSTLPSRQSSLRLKKSWETWTRPCSPGLLSLLPSPLRSSAQS